MTPPCPQCRSPRVVALHHARKAGGTVGAIAGAASSIFAAVNGARAGGRFGASLGVVAGPTGRSLGIIAGAILGGLLGGATGCSAGAVLGELIDDKILDNYRCLDCAHTFGQMSEASVVPIDAAFDDAEPKPFRRPGFASLSAGESFQSVVSE